MTVRSATTRFGNVHRRRGAALLEFVLCIPLLAGIIVLTFFFGWSMKNQQRVRVSDRYTAWRWVHGGRDAPTHANLNGFFFDFKAGEVWVDGGGGPTETLTDLVGEVARISPQAAALAEELVTNRFPHGQSASVAATFPTDVVLWQRLSGGAMSHHHVREGVEWRRGQASCEDVLADEFYHSLDTAMSTVPAPGDGLGQCVRRLYLTRW